MTPAARWAAAARIVDEIGQGEPAEKALTTWARKSRFAGSKDRAAIRDHVFDILRNWRSTAALGGAETGRGRVLGRLRQTGEDPSLVFSGTGYGLNILTDAEHAAGQTPVGAAAADLPDWLFSLFVNELPGDALATAEALRHRAQVYLRVNTIKANRGTAQAALADDGIQTVPHPLSDTALEVTANARRVSQSTAFQSGLVELQDVASQAVVEALPLDPGMRVLDYCAGGGGKTLAMAAYLNGPVEAHDANPRRMSDLPQRAARAGADVRVVPAPKGLYDLVLCDAPCSGSGSWRRAPDGKWRLTPDSLDRLTQVQADILDKAVACVASDGVLAYATCSVLRRENEDQITGFLQRHPDWVCTQEGRFGLVQGGDGFFLATLKRKTI